jgi:hypothetical protein
MPSHRNCSSSRCRVATSRLGGPSRSPCRSRRVSAETLVESGRIRFAQTRLRAAHDGARRRFTDPGLDRRRAAAKPVVIDASALLAWLLGDNPPAAAI